MILGYLGGGLLALYFSRKLFKSRSKRNEYQISLIFLTISAFPAIFLGTVVGGSLGGAYGEQITQAIGLGSMGVPIGLAFGLTTTISLIMLVGASIGYYVSTGFYKYFGKTI